ncbi:RibD family protein [Aquipuribacter sp. SD81]|uniref:RibD family protein n=1 Tax=Aquipuribacter sp. SD81 TaxID=3127703 RepID=UPI00301B25BC
MVAADAEVAWRWLLSRAGRAPGDARAGGARPPAPRVADDAAPEPSDEDAADLLALYGPVATARGRLAVGQLGQSLDGCIATRTGDARYVTGDADRAHLHRLRALVDAVLVGVGTVCADDPRLTVRAVAGPHPHRVVLDPAGRCPVGSRVLADGAPTTWLVSAAGVRRARRAVAGRAAVRVVGLPAGPAGAPVPPPAVLDLLAGLGLGRVLVEGGGRTVTAFVRAGALDRLHLSVAPVLLGADGTTGLGLPGPALARDALRPPSRNFRLGDDVCFDLDLAAVRERQREQAR